MTVQISDRFCSKKFQFNKYSICFHMDLNQPEWYLWMLVNPHNVGIYMANNILMGGIPWKLTELLKRRRPILRPAKG